MTLGHFCSSGSAQATVGLLRQVGVLWSVVPSPAQGPWGGGRRHPSRHPRGWLGTWGG